MHESHSTDRRRFLATAAGLAAAAAPFVGDANGETRPTAATEAHSIRSPHFRPRAKRVIFLFMLGGPSQHDLFDDKPKLRQLDGQPIGDELLSRMKFAQIMEQRPSLLGSHVKFARHGQSGAEVSELLPHTAQIVDDLAIVKTVKAEEIPHHPAEVYWHTGTRQFGRPSIGAWVQYGLGSESSDLPGYVVLQSGMRPRTKGSIYTAGFLSAAYQGVPLRDGAEPILNLAPPPGRSLDDERRIVDVVRHMNALRSTVTRDPETDARSAAYQLAQRLSETAPEAIDVGRESAATLAKYGVDPRQPSFARNCLLARRLVERGVRFVHLCHGDWDHHSNLRQGLAAMCQQTDQACAAL
ncbi:MAG TPA: DUF1501 domain-containing protein, partial [Pirellulaceae bacterium]|nr:DUF1501 domain-containing protein [Pirellulaceae bacterium]